jgi:hypothetical protein
MVALPRPSIPSGKPELASQAAVSGLTNVVPCVTARCACNRHPARERRQGRCALILLLPEWLLVWSPRGPLWCPSLRDF